MDQSAIFIPQKDVGGTKLMEPPNGECAIIIYGYASVKLVVMLFHADVRQIRGGLCQNRVRMSFLILHQFNTNL